MAAAEPPTHDALFRDWQRNAQYNEDANFRFLRSLKMVDDPDAIDALAGELHREAFTTLDCTRCAHCCKTMQPRFTAEDITRIAAHRGQSPEVFTATYLERDSEEEFRTKSMPCPLLADDGRCTVYEVRPAACREFPHTDKPGFTTRSYLHSDNTVKCPAVYYIVKQLRRAVRRSR